MSNNDDVHKIRFAGRHILTIGRELIQDQFAAILELVKNSYDADSTKVTISISIPEQNDTVKIVIGDDGHGMDRDTVINKWLVPSTDDKLKRKTSPEGRIMQGRKGIGRYAASYLGDELLLETIAKGVKTTVLLNWEDFAKADFVDQVDILVESKQTTEPNGTRLTIQGGKQYVADWINGHKKSPFEQLERDLKKLISPIDLNFSGEIDAEKFEIILQSPNFHGKKQIKPYPILEFFDYRISGVIDFSGEGILEFVNQKARNTVTEKINYPINMMVVPTGCGRLVFDLRFYDRDSKSMGNLIQRGLRNESGYPFGKREAKKLLDEIVGIGIYRGGFRIRPTGEPWFDWLELNRRRVQNPGLRIGSDRVAGYIQIESEEKSRLEEKSARDGLRENNAYQRLKIITEHVIGLVESRRYQYLQQAGLQKNSTKIESDLDKLVELGGLKTRIEQRLIQAGVDKETATNDASTLIAEKETEIQQVVENIRQAIAIYQGQATLGKIINVVLHEGRKPLSFLVSQSSNFQFWVEEYFKTQDENDLHEAVKLSTQFESQAKSLSSLFRRIDPLAARKRGRKTTFNLRDEIKSSFLVFETSLYEKKIQYEIDCDSTFKFTGWPSDIQIIFTNLIENSIYWIDQKPRQEKKIVVNVVIEQSVLMYIDYRDTGAGIEPSFIRSEVIFEPQFSTKPDGTGLGLALAGESALRNGLELHAIEYDDGAYFRLSTKQENL